MELKQQGFSFKVNGTTVDFAIIHDLTDDIPLENLFNGWRGQATTFTAETFCEYVYALHKDRVCLTLAEYQEMVQSGLH